MQDLGEEEGMQQQQEEDHHRIYKKKEDFFRRFLIVSLTMPASQKMKVDRFMKSRVPVKEEKEDEKRRGLQGEKEEVEMRVVVKEEEEGEVETARTDDQQEEEEIIIESQGVVELQEGEEDQRMKEAVALRSRLILLLLVLLPLQGLKGEERSILLTSAVQVVEGVDLVIPMIALLISFSWKTEAMNNSIDYLPPLSSRG